MHTHTHTHTHSPSYLDRNPTSWCFQGILIEEVRKSFPRKASPPSAPSIFLQFNSSTLLTDLCLCLCMDPSLCPYLALKLPISIMVFALSIFLPLIFLLDSLLVLFLTKASFSVILQHCDHNHLVSNSFLHLLKTREKHCWVRASHPQREKKNKL
jgi:hypothetical protein